MPPDFSKNTIEVLAKRAAFLCSNPDCHALTVGPNSEASKATNIGEAAHIYGARLDAPRYAPQMSDMARAEITNGIWLCRNCHVKVDRDAQKYSAGLLFKWREDLDHHVASNLGGSALMRFDLETTQMAEFSNYPPIVRRILVDKPDGWEWRLTAELLRHLNRPVFRKLRDLQNGLYTRPLERIDGIAWPWVSARLAEMQNFSPPIEKLLARLNESWGPPGVAGDASKIHHVCCLLRDVIQQIVDHEERLWFVNVDEDYQPLVNLLKDCIGSQVLKLETIPTALDETVALLGTSHSGTKEKPLLVQKVITFELPDSWVKDMERELHRLGKKQTNKTETFTNSSERSTFWNVFLLLIIVIALIYVYS